MFPLESIASTAVDELLLYIALLGILLLVATELRLRVPFLKRYYIPASLLAGVIGLILGPNVLKVIPQEVVSTWSTRKNSAGLNDFS